MMEYISEVFTIPEAALICGGSAQAYRRWMREGLGVVVPDQDKGDEFSVVLPEARGKDTLINYHTLIQLAVAQKLIDLGVPVKAALEAGLEFMIGNKYRHPSSLYTKGETWLIHAQDSTMIVCVGTKISDSDFYKTLPDAIASVLGYASRDCDGAVAVVDMERVISAIPPNIQHTLRSVRHRNNRLK